MPELPEVEITVRKLKKQGLVGSRLGYFEFLSPKQFRSHMTFRSANKDIAGRNVESIRRKGKVLFIGINGKPPRIMAIHLKMSGRLFVISKKEPRGSATRFVIGFKDGRELRLNDPRRFAVVWYDPPDKIFENKYLSSLGPDMLGVSYREFEKRLALYSKSAIKGVLLRQDVFSGIGNIIADEALWTAKIHPQTKAVSLDIRQIKTLYSAIMGVIRRILKAGGTSMRDWGHPDKERGDYQNRFKIYGQTECPRCGLLVRKIVVAGRSSSICSGCQRKPRP